MAPSAVRMCQTPPEWSNSVPVVTLAPPIVVFSVAITSTSGRGGLPDNAACILPKNAPTKVIDRIAKLVLVEDRSMDSTPATANIVRTYAVEVSR